MRIISCLCLIYLLLLTGISGLNAQVVLQSDAGIRSGRYTLPPEIKSRANEPDTLFISPGQPFFDDFSYPDASPDTSKWFIPEGSNRRSPRISRHLARRPPSRGAVVFDGLNEQGLPYNSNVLTSGHADSLVSHYLDLSGYGPGDNIRLSFCLQPQGFGEAPEATDSFLVYFISPAKQQKVYAKGGGKVKDFFSVIIPVNQAAWFSQKFQLAFVNVGAQFGQLDLWHLDYVYLGFNRAANDTIFNDYSPTRVITPITFPFTAIPAQHYTSLSPLMNDFGVELSSLAGSSQTVSVKTDISDPLGGTSFFPVFEQVKSVGLLPHSSTSLNFSPFGEQNISQIARIRHRIEITANADDHPENDGFEESIPVDSVFAYDDGEADMGFGLNKALSFGVRFDMQKEDSISAVWICFVPTVNFNPVNNQTVYMDGKSFRLRIWKGAHPDSILFEQVGGMKVIYGNKSNTFVRYPLNKIQKVPATFWIGMQQLDDNPIGVGYDLSYNHDSFTYWDSLGNWINLRLGGTLMIRPEFYNTTPIPSSVSGVLPDNKLVSIYPNPANSTRIHIHWEPDKYLIKSYRATLRNMQGRQVWSMDNQMLEGDEPLVIMPSYLPPAIYLWEHRIILANGKMYIHREKFVWLPDD